MEFPIKVTLNIDDAHRRFLDDLIVTTGFGTLDEYVSYLIKRDRARHRDQQRARNMIVKIARQKGDVSDADHDAVEAEINRPRIEALREMLRPAIEQADRGEFVEFSMDDIKREARAIRDKRRAAATRRAAKSNAPKAKRGAGGKAA